MSEPCRELQAYQLIGWCLNPCSLCCSQTDTVEGLAMKFYNPGFLSWQGIPTLVYRHDRNYEELFNDVRNKLDQVGFCAGETGHVSPDTPRSVRPIFSLALLICYEGLLADLLACLEYVHTGCLTSADWAAIRKGSKLIIATALTSWFSECSSQFCYEHNQRGTTVLQWCLWCSVCHWNYLGIPGHGWRECRNVSDWLHCKRSADGRSDKPSCTAGESWEQSLYS